VCVCVDMWMCMCVCRRGDEKKIHHEEADDGILREYIIIFTVRRYADSTQNDFRPPIG